MAFNLGDKILYSIFALMVAAGVGYYYGKKSMPLATSTVKDTKQSQTHETQVTTTIKKKDGTVTTTTTTNILRDVTDNKVKSVEIPRPNPKWTVGPLLGTDISSINRPTYGLFINYKILGPLSITGVGFTNKFVGAGIGITF